MKAISVIILTISLIQLAQAQQVVTSAGDEGHAGNIKVGWTIGEPLAETFYGASFTLTQGMQQGHLLVTFVPELFQADELNVYPNPIDYILNIEIREEKTYSYQYKLFTNDGKVFQQGLLKEQHNSIQMEHLPKGVYYLGIMPADKKNESIFKILKN